MANEPVEYHVFKTHLGWVGLAWSQAGLRRVSFPVGSKAAAEKAVAHTLGVSKRARKFPEWTKPLAEQISTSMTNVPRKIKKKPPLPPFDFEGVSAFDETVYRALLKVPYGKTLSVSQLAENLGVVNTRAIHQAIQRNPFALVIPCYRVIDAATSARSLASKTRLLELEALPAKPRTFVHRGFDLEAALKQLARNDPRLAKLMKNVGPFKLQIRKGGSPFHWLLRSILYQQLNGKAASTIHERLRALFGGRDPEPNELLEMASERLQAAGVSRQKLAALKDLARAAATGQVPDLKTLRKMHDEEIIEALTPIRGVGRWTVEMLLIFGLGRADVLAVDDFAIRKSAMILHDLKNMPDRHALHALGDRWKPFRSLASWYLWRALD